MEQKSKMSDAVFSVLLAMVISGIGGFIYETIFYRFALGYFVKRGSTFGPWIPIYAFGALGIIAAVWRFRKNPLAVFFISTVVTGLIEFAVGWVLLTVFKVRLWDYNVEPLNFGNIGGFICLRSVVLFGFFGLLLMYGVLPLIKYVKSKIPHKMFVILCVGIFFVFICDIFIYLLVKGV